MPRKATAKKVEPAPQAVAEAPEKRTEPPPDFKPSYFHETRNSTLAEIAARNREDRDAVMREEGVEPEDTSGEDLDAAAKAREEGDGDEPGEQKPDEGVAAAEGAGTAEGDTPPPVVEPPKTFKLKVNGQEKEFTEEQLIAIAQKSESADQRLEEATRLRDEARRMAKPPAPGVSETPPSGAPSAPDVGKAPSVDVAKLTSALLYGQEEEVKSALTTLVSEIGRRRAGEMAGELATQTQGMKPEEMRAFVSEAIAFENAKSYLDKPPEQGGFADIWSDPVLQTRFIQRESEIANELAQQGEKATYLDIYNRVATELRGWRDGIIQKYAPPTGLEDRGNSKRQAGIVRGAGGKTPPPQESQPKTHEEKLEQLRKARGQT